MENSTIDKSIDVDNSVSEDKSIDVDNTVGEDNSIAIKSEMNTSNSIVSENPPADRIYTVDGKTYFESYDGNGNKFVAEMIDIPHEHPDNSPDDVPSEKYNLNKDFYSELNLEPGYGFCIGYFL